MNAVDPQKRIEHRPQHRHQPYQTDPGNRRARVPLVQYRMPRGKYGEYSRERRHEKGTQGLEGIKHWCLQRYTRALGPAIGDRPSAAGNSAVLRNRPRLDQDARVWPNLARLVEVKKV
jgi:hypothetical protein